MNILSAIKSRRSVRKFSKRIVTNQVIEQIISSCIWAPSACDVQGWRFIVITEDSIKRHIVEMGAASFIKGSPAGILVLYDNRTDNLEYMDHIQSASAAIQNMLLAAHSMGLGSCWVCHLPPKKQIRRLLKIPHNYDPIAYVAMGYFDIKLKPRPRKKEISQLISYNCYKINESIPPKVNLRLSAKRILRKGYYKLPFRKHIKATVDDLFEKRFE